MIKELLAFNWFMDFKTPNLLIVRVYSHRTWFPNILLILRSLNGINLILFSIILFICLQWQPITLLLFLYDNYLRSLLPICNIPTHMIINFLVSFEDIWLNVLNNRILKACSWRFESLVSVYVHRMVTLRFLLSDVCATYLLIRTQSKSLICNYLFLNNLLKLRDSREIRTYTRFSILLSL